MLSFVSSVVFRLWALTIFFFTQVARLIISILNLTMFPRQKTHSASHWAVGVWMLINLGLFTWCVVYLTLRTHLYTAIALATLQFLIIVSALLVITEENDVWAGYVRYDRIGGKDGRTFKHGKVVKSLPLLVLSAILYLAYSAVAVKAWHAENAILNVRYDAQIPLWHYIATVAAQVPIFDTLLKWTNAKVAMDFQGISGISIKLVIYVSNVSIILGTLNSYFHQKSQIRRLIEGLGGETGNIPVLQAQASRAPDEIKTALLKMALHDSEARVRRRAMTVAQFANILTFPTTLVYNLHKETKERNKHHALTVSAYIIENNRNQLDTDYFEALDRKIEFQLQHQRRRHKQKTLDLLVRLRKVR
jgi:hypothetical protein